MSKKYLVNLSGGGDIYYFVVSKAAFDWIDSPRPTFPPNSYSVNEVVPANVLADNPKLRKACCVTTGSCENDRALHLMDGSKTYDRYPAKQGPFADEWTGCVY